MSKNLAHHFLIATPQMPDDRFNRSVVYICRHDKQGALGLIINKPLADTTIVRLLEDLDIACQNKTLIHEMALSGGPVAPEVGFVLHTGQPAWASSFGISENVSITTSRDILEHMAMGDASGNFQMCLGHASWGAKQIMTEIEQGDWLVCPADLELLFKTPYDKRWHKAGEKMGLNLDFLSADVGNA